MISSKEKTVSERDLFGPESETFEDENDMGNMYQPPVYGVNGAQIYSRSTKSELLEEEKLQQNPDDFQIHSKEEARTILL